MSTTPVQIRKALETRQENITTIDSTVCSATLGTTHSLTLGENVVKATANTASGSYTLYLPNVAEAAGMLYSIEVTIANAKVVTIADNDESLDWADYLLSVDGDGLLLYSDGRKWWSIAGKNLFVACSGAMAAGDLVFEIFTAPAACKLVSVTETHSVVCDAADTIQIEKLTTGEDSDAGDDLLPAVFTLNTTKDTPITQAVVAVTRTLAAGDRLAPVFVSGDGTNWVGSITLLLEWV